MFCLQTGASFGKSHLLNGAKFGKSKQKQNGAKFLYLIFFFFYIYLFRLNALLETSQLGMNMHFSSLAEGPVQEEPHELPIAEAIPSDIGDFLSIARKKRSIGKTDGPTEIAKILPNGRVCFAGQTLRYRVPRDPQQARNFIGIINSFILFLSHVHGQQSGHFLPLRMASN